MNKPEPEAPKCCICKKRKAAGSPVTLNSGKRVYSFFYVGACDNAKCILARQKEVKG